MWVRALFYTVLMAVGWTLLGLLFAFHPLLAIVGSPVILLLLLCPLSMALIFRGEGPAFGAMIAAGVALLVTAFAVPGDLYLAVFGSSRQAVVVDETCVRTKGGGCSRQYRLEGTDGSPITGPLRHGAQDVGDEIKVIVEPAGVLPPRRARDVTFGFFDLVALVAWLSWIAVVFQGVRADRRARTGPGESP